MHPDNETCVQRARFFFYFSEKTWEPGEKPPLEDILKSKKISPQAVRNLKDFLSIRLERIATMLELLTEAHDDWAMTGKKEYILLETETYDFNHALKLLKDHGFKDTEFVLKVEYTRKWGVL
ncbi:hypothetical protein Desde_4001 [Desulfitobacterium dehalogenans ATCC 51507]|uniref:Uncharacterized protein n=1 Tax=Desulfitobacterium dehalogenans (strain ATCC 51507 / DSM 9161 / JW/IU-DC1) TaxID=756499 RepID=I4AE78_DESDJ|nr:hypothetical protein [Desulfitobacterium dehalogenans]AFM02263.1 hypothetical protein Desde_4001 [Desulfitobacterium dehalogenans ATCC 51507]